jgi:ferredoxin
VSAVADGNATAGIRPPGRRAVTVARPLANVAWTGQHWRERPTGATAPAADTDGMRITVDYDLCEGHGQCLMAAPELFDLPDGSEQAVVLDPDPPESQRDRAVRAVAMCPALAITVS